MSASSSTDESGTLLVRGGFVGDVTEGSSPHDRPVTAGTRLGRYLVIEELGRGGMGVVLRAYDPKLEREVALKLLRRGALGEAAQARLVREARAMARLSHPNVVAVYDVELEATSPDEGGAGVVLVMEYVPGTTLRQWLESTSPSKAAIIEAFVAAGRGLAAAHAEGVLHRDFKPDNVLVQTELASHHAVARVLVTDFGLARPETADSWRSSDDDERPVWEEWPESSSGSTALTKAGTVMGTPPYMAPEQLSGGEVDARVDQYAFCVSAWEALTGRRPFEGRGTALAKAKRAGPGPWPSDVSVPRHIAEALRRGLQPRPGDRWPNMRALLAELGRDPKQRRRRAIALTLLVVAPVAGWGVHRVLLAQTLAGCAREADRIFEIYDDARADEIATAFAATDVTYAADTWARARKGLDEYARQWSTARKQVCEQAEVEGLLSEPLARAARDCLDERADRLAALLELLSKPDPTAVQRAAMATASLPLVVPCTDERRLHLRALPPRDFGVREQLKTIRAGLAQASAARATGRYEDGLRLARDVVTQAEQVDWPPIVAEARLELADAQSLTGAYEDAAATYEQAFVDAGAAGHDELALDAATALMFVLGNDLAQHDRARIWGSVAKMLAERLDLTDAFGGVRLLNSLGVLHQTRGELDEARRCFERSLEIKERTLGAEHPQIAMSLSNIALVDHAEGSYAQALAHLESALAVWEASLGPEHPTVAGMLHNIGGVQQSLGNFEEAIHYYERSLAVAENAFGQAHRDTAMPLNNLGLVHMDLGHYDRARPLFERSITILEEALGPDHPDLATALDNLGDLYLATDEPAEALRLFERVHAIAEKAHGPDHENLAEAVHHLGLAHRDLGDADKARTLFEQSIAVLENGSEHPHAYLAEPLQSLGELQHARGEHAEAIANLERALEVGKANDAAPLQLATTRFALARALWDGNKDPRRARDLATEARNTLDPLPPRGADLLAEIRAWQTKHGSE